MNKVVAVIFCLIASFSVSALEWPHENISTAEFA